jgi:polyisoprenoid-binding protein YceI
MEPPSLDGGRIDVEHQAAYAAPGDSGPGLNVVGPLPGDDVGASAVDTVVEATIDLASVDTNNAERDAHLRSTDFFDTDRHPEMVFVSTALTGERTEWCLEGELTLNGITRPITLDVEFNGIEAFPGRNETHAGFPAAGNLRRSEFGIEFGLLPIGMDKLALADKVHFDLDLQFVAPDDGEPTGLSA